MATARAAELRGSYDPRALGAKCDACPLKGKKPVPPSPSMKPPRFVIVGEAPGRLEVRHGRPFVGPSGMLLDKALKKAGLRRHEAHVTNVMLCMPDDDRPEVKLAASSCCSGRLAVELERTQPVIVLRPSGSDDAPIIQEALDNPPVAPPILALGTPAVRVLLGVNGILKSRGFVWETAVIPEKKVLDAHKALAKMRKGAKAPSTLKRVEKKQAAVWLLEARSRFPGRTVIPSVHPAFILRGADGYLPIYYNDVKRFRRLLDGELELEDEAPYRVASKPADVTKLIGRLRGVLAVDVETSGPSPLQDKLLCVGVSDGKKTVVVFPWKRALAGALKLAFSGRELVMHNGAQFDQIVLAREGVLT